MRKRMISLLLACGLFMSLFGCMETLPVGTQPVPTGPVLECIYPEVRMSELKYTLSDADVEAFDRQLRVCDSLFSTGDKKKINDFLEALYKLETAMANIEVQVDFAYLLYKLNLRDTRARQNYLEADAVYTQVSNRFWDWINSIRSQDNVLLIPLEAFLQDRYPALYPVAEGYSEKLRQIEAEYASYLNQGTPEQMLPLYQSYLETTRSYARACGSVNYYEQVSVRWYNRDYGKQERRQFRAFVKEYLVPLCRTYRQRMQSGYRDLNAMEDAYVRNLIYDPYNSHWGDPWGDYLDALPETVAAAMRSAFTQDRALIGEGKNAEGRAFTRLVGDTPICYFSSAEMDLKTMSHEIGHYYAYLCQGDLEMSQDLQETHSGGNTMLLLSHMEQAGNNRMVTTFRIHLVYDLLYKAVKCTIEDEFDELVCSDAGAKDYTAQQLQELMEELIRQYDVADLGNMEQELLADWYTGDITDIGYDISYATSAVAALQLYAMARTDYSGAVECYRALVEGVDEKSTFLGTLKKAGLQSPFEEKTYIMLMETAQM